MRQKYQSAVCIWKDVVGRCLSRYTSLLIPRNPYLSLASGIHRFSPSCLSLPVTLKQPLSYASVSSDTTCDGLIVTLASQRAGYNMPFRFLQEISLGSTRREKHCVLYCTEHLIAASACLEKEEKRRA